MRTIANLLVCIVTAFAAWEPLTHLLADTPLPKPERKEVRSANGRLYAVMDPKRSTTVVYRVESGERSERQWTIRGWYRVADLTDEGVLIVGHGGINLVPLNVTKDEPMIRFFRSGELIKTVTLGELLKDQASLQRTVSHYHWGSYLGLDEKGRYAVETVEGQEILFDAATGERIAQARAPDSEKALAEDRLPTPDYHRQPSDPAWLAQVVQLHGHLGPSVVAGARMGMIGLRAVGAKGYFDVDVTCEGPMARPPQSCFLDGIQAATGATMGKRTLAWVPADQIAVRIRNTRTGKTAELRPTPALMELLASFKSQAKAGAEHGPSQQDHERLEAIARKIAVMSEKGVAGVKVVEGKETK